MQKLNNRESYVYNKLEDDKSRHVFLARKAYGRGIREPQKCPKDSIHIDNFDFTQVFEKTPGYNDLINTLKNNIFALYGAGAYSKVLLALFDHLGLIQNISVIFDNNKEKQDTTLQGIKIVRPSFSKNLVVMGVSELSRYFQESVDLLCFLGYDKTQIIKPYFKLWNTDEMYFDKNIILPLLKDNEVFVDAGCFDFSDCNKFITYTSGGGYIRI